MPCIVLHKFWRTETIVIQRNNREVARMVSTIQVNWREKMYISLKALFLRMGSSNHGKIFGCAISNSHQRG